MKWVEMIQVRPRLQDRSKAQQTLEQLAEELGSISSLRGVRIWTQTDEFGDLAMILQWENDRQPVKTREGYLVAETMHTFGALSHTVWNEKQGK